MKTLFHIHLHGKQKSQRGFARKQLDLPFAPAIGMEVESSAWKQTRKVVNVALNVDDGAIFVDLGVHEIGDWELDAFTYEGHGWTLSDDLQRASASYAAQRGLSNA